MGEVGMDVGFVGCSSVGFTMNGCGGRPRFEFGFLERFSSCKRRGFAIFGGACLCGCRTMSTSAKTSANTSGITVLDSRCKLESFEGWIGKSPSSIMTNRECSRGTSTDLKGWCWFGLRWISIGICICIGGCECV